MNFEFLDHYLLDGSPAKSEVVRRLLESPPPAGGAAAFLEGIRLLGARTPELTFIALRLVLAGKKADDASVVELRETVERARTGDESARARYRTLFESAKTKGTS